MGNIEDMVGVEAIMQATTNEFFGGDPVRYALNLAAWIYRDPELMRPYTKDDKRNDYHNIRVDPSGNNLPVGISFIAGMDKFPNMETLVMQFHRYNCFLPYAPPVHVIKGDGGPNILSEKEREIIDKIRKKEKFNTEPLEEKLQRYAKCWTATKKAYEKENISPTDRFRNRVENATFENLFANTYRQLWLIFHQEGRGLQLPLPETFFPHKEDIVIPDIEGAYVAN